MYASEVYRNSLVTSNFVTQNEVYEIAGLLEQTSDIKFTKISFEGLKNEIINTDEELTNYYNDNQVQFYSEEQRNFSYILLDPVDYESKVQVPDGYIQTAYDAYLLKNEASTQIRISHIMVEKNNYDSRDSAYAIISEVENLISEGEDFSKLAMEYSDDVVTKENGGDLEYFEQDVFPIEFEDAITDLGLNEISKIVELEDTFHILKITEINSQEPLSEDQIKDDLTNELIQTESFALMQDDFSELEDMIYNNTSISEIAANLSKTKSTSEYYSINNFDFFIDDLQIKDYLFSLDSRVGEIHAIEIANTILVMSIDAIIEPTLISYENIKDEVEALLTESKAIDKIELMDIELNSIEDKSDKSAFIEAYSFISSDEFIDVKRYSSLLPREVLTNIFNESAGKVISVNANNGDKYMINIIDFKKPSEADIVEIIEQYESFADESISTRISNIVNEDVFEKAKVKLQNVLL